jgi:hypothetical protein
MAVAVNRLPGDGLCGRREPDVVIASLRAAHLAQGYGRSTYSGAVVFSPLWQQFPMKFGR